MASIRASSFETPLSRLLRMRKNYSAGCNAREALSGFLAGFGAPTRSRRSESDNMPPNAINTGPHQIRSTSGL